MSEEGERLDPETGMPVHLAMPVNADGDGPALPADTVRVICWCADPECELWRESWRR